MLPLSIVSEKLGRLNNWALDGSAISKDFSFISFKDVMEFVNKISEIAERQSHYPTIIFGKNMVKVSLTTHSEGGLTSKDFEFAEEMDKL